MKRLALILVTALAAAPVLLLTIWSFARGWYWPALVPREWSFRAWSYLASSGGEASRAMLTSVTIAAGVALVSVITAIPAARALALHQFRMKRAVIFFLLLPLVAPPIVSTMGLHRLFLLYGLTDDVFGVALAHLVPALPYAILMLFGSFSRFDPDYESQARTLGAHSAAVWRYVTLPAIAPGIAAAFAFAFLVSWSQYLLTLLIGGGQVLTLPLELVQFQRSGDESVAAVLALAFLAPAIVVIGLVSRYLKDS